MDFFKTLVITGMHRSGTSLTANWLARCGLQVGDALTMNLPDNPSGHYEDKFFVGLHRDILSENGLNYLVSNHQKIVPAKKHRERAERLIIARSNYIQWGWKDPRTSLFLDFWKTLLPDMKVLIVYRHYAQVVGSLLRRELLQLLNRVRSRRYRLSARLEYSYFNVPLLKTYAGVWSRYNQDILAFVAANPDDILVIHIDDLFSFSDKIIAFLNAQWGFNLAQVDINDIFVPRMLHNDGMIIRSQILLRLEPQCQQVYHKLERWREKTHLRIEDSLAHVNLKETG